jgi:lipopolysaccharide export system protein LptC
VIELINPRLVDDMNRVVSAPRGFYSQTAQYLELFEDVVAEEAEGYVFRTTQARLYITEGRVEGVAPLTGEGPIGEISADSYEILEDGSSFRFSGRVRTTLYPKGKPSDGGG